MQFLTKITFGAILSLIYTSAVAQVDIVQIKKDIEYLSSDELAGRQTGSEGELKSATYIAERFAKLKLKKKGDSYFQNFEITQLRIAKNSCEMAFINPMTGEKFTSLKLFKDFFPISECTDKDSVVGLVQDVGYGLISEAEKRNDFEAEKDIAGKIFFVRLGYADMDENPHSALADVSSIEQKIENCIKYGAAGIVFVPGPKKAEVPKGELKKFLTTKNIPIFYASSITNIIPRGITVMLKSDIYEPQVVAHNVAGYRNYRKKNTIVVVAHHDHIGMNEYGNSRHTGPAEIHNGADDNASGVATMLELARTLKGRKYCKNNYLFLAVSGEELGLLGSKFFVNHPLVKLSKINYVINIDMLGRMDTVKNALIVNGTGTSPNWYASLNKLKIDTNEIHIVRSESGVGASDHTSFYLKDIPVLHFFSGQHVDYHKPSDDAWKINYEGMDKYIDVIKQVVRDNNKKKKIPFTKTKEVEMKSSKWKVSLGIMPDYAFEGSGLRIDGVTEDKPASKAGLLAGDIVTKMGETIVTDIYTYMKVLSKLNEGDVLDVTVVREGKEVVKSVTF